MEERIRRQMLKYVCVNTATLLMLIPPFFILHTPTYLRELIQINTETHTSCLHVHTPKNTRIHQNITHVRTIKTARTSRTHSPEAIPVGPWTAVVGVRVVGVTRGLVFVAATVLA